MLLADGGCVWVPGMDGHCKDASVSPAGVGGLTTEDVAAMAATIRQVWTSDQ